VLVRPRAALAGPAAGLTTLLLSVAMAGAAENTMPPERAAML
jgi:hypothetical protein